MWLQLLEESILVLMSGAQAAIASGVGGTQDKLHVQSAFSIISAMISSYQAAKQAEATASGAAPSTSAAVAPAAPAPVTVAVQAMPLTPVQSLEISARGQA